jgi:hypothetical protein
MTPADASAIPGGNHGTPVEQVDQGFEQGEQALAETHPSPIKNAKALRDQ